VLNYHAAFAIRVVRTLFAVNEFLALVFASQPKNGGGTCPPPILHQGLRSFQVKCAAVCLLRCELPRSVRQESSLVRVAGLGQVVRLEGTQIRKCGVLESINNAVRRAHKAVGNDADEAEVRQVRASRSHDGRGLCAGHITLLCNTSKAGHSGFQSRRNHQHLGRAAVLDTLAGRCLLTSTPGMLRVAVSERMSEPVAGRVRASRALAHVAGDVGQERTPSYQRRTWPCRWSWLGSP